MNDSTKQLFMGFFIGIVFSFVICGVWILPCLSHESYRQGQIDYANDIIKYELREQDNHEYIWVEKEGN